MKRSIIIGAILLVIGIVIGWLCRQSCIRPEVVIQRDTLVRVDTVREPYPVAIREEVVDTFMLIVRDTVRIKDTLYLNLPIEKRMYASDEYYAEVSGYRASLDYIEVYPKTKIITEKITSVRSKNYISAGIEVGYMNAFSTPIYLEYGRMLHKNVSFYGQLSYDLRLRSIGAGLGIKAQLEW